MTLMYSVIQRAVELCKRLDISLTPLQRDIAGYNTAMWKGDFFAAFAVALLSIPQALAYAIVVGLPPSCGLLSTILGTSIAALLGSSRHLVSGPNNTTVLLVQGGVTAILYKFYPNLSEATWEQVALQITAALVLLIGIFQMVVSVFKLGRIIQFVSIAVIIGYVAGTCFALVIDQLYTFLGISIPDDFPSLFEKARYLALHLSDSHFPTALVGILSLCMLAMLRTISTFIPSSLIMLACMTLFVSFFGLDTILDASGHTLSLIGDVGGLESVFPPLQLPLFEARLLNTIVPIAFAIAIFSMLETVTIAKSTAASSGEQLSTNQEIFGLGIANMVLSCFGALPATGSISRTAVNVEHGAQTRFSAIMSALFVALFVILCGFFIQYIPRAATAALIVATALRVIDIRQLKFCFKATKSDACVMCITFAACIFFSLSIAFYMGVGLSILLYLRKVACPHVVEYVYNEETEELYPITRGTDTAGGKVRIVNIEGELFFGAVDYFQSALKACAAIDNDTKVFVLRLKHVRDMDASGAYALKQLFDYLKNRGVALVIVSIPHDVWAVLESAGLSAYIGEENLFRLNDGHSKGSLRAGVQRALAICFRVGEGGNANKEQTNSGEDKIGPAVSMPF